MTTLSAPGSAVCEGVLEHCCHLAGQVCRYLEERSGPGRRFVCTIRERLGSWDAVHVDPDYVRDVQPIVLEVVGVDCGGWPRRGESCAACGAAG